MSEDPLCAPHGTFHLPHIVRERSSFVHEPQERSRSSHGGSRTSWNTCEILDGLRRRTRACIVEDIGKAGPLACVQCQLYGWIDGR